MGNCRATAPMIPYSIPVSMGDDPLHSTGVYRSVRSPDRLLHNFTDQYTSSYSVFLASLRKFPDADCLGTCIRDSVSESHYEWLSYSQVEDLIKNCAKFLQHSFLASEEHNLVAIMAPNCNEWVITDLACGLLAIPVVPLYQDASRGTLRQILSETEVTTVFGNQNDLLRIAAIGSPYLRNLICFTPPTQKLLAASQFKIYNYWRQLGSKATHSHLLLLDKQPTLRSLYSIVYSSGTTGPPKGVMLTNGNMISSLYNFINNQEITHHDTIISYLPLAHVYGRAMCMAPLQSGGRIGHYSGNIRELGQDMRILKPTIFPTLPLVLNKIYESIIYSAGKQNPFKKMMFKQGLRYKTRQLHKKAAFSSAYYDRHVFQRIKQRLGGNIRLIFSGGAQNSSKVLQFFRVAFSANVCEIYGLTESSGASFMTRPFETRKRICGGPTLGTQFKLQDVPQMNYLHTDTPYPRGEICIRGPSVFTGYFGIQNNSIKGPIDRDGWLHTGDIGMLLEGGAVQIIDRKSSIFKLMHGEFLSPERIQRVYQSADVVLQVFVYGDSARERLVAVIVPDQYVIRSLAGKAGAKSSLQELCRRKQVHQAVQAQLDQRACGRLKECEKVGPLFYLEPELWETGGEMLTPTSKLRRHVAKEKYRTIIERLYAASM